MASVLRHKVLVLNRGWQPVGVVSLERAICLLVSAYRTGEPRARIIDPTQEFRQFTWHDWSAFLPKEGEEAVHSARQSFRVPSIILLSRYKKIPEQKVSFNRRTLYKRDQNTCQYCRKQPGTANLNIDHVIPRCQGGLSTWENCVLSCFECNCKKAGRTPQQAGMTLIRKPFKPRFTVSAGDYWREDWNIFLKGHDLVSAAYWATEMQSDNKD